MGRHQQEIQRSPDHPGRSGALDGAWNEGGELKFARMCERKFGHKAFSPVPPQALHFKNHRNRAVPWHLLHGAEINRVPHGDKNRRLPLNRALACSISPKFH
jgi:hypothetical protein